MWCSSNTNISQNESVLGNISRLGYGSREDTKNKIAGRMKDDNYVIDIYNDMIKDFEESGKDLNKINLIKNERLTYVFGEFDRIKNSPFSGNQKNGNIKINVSYIKPEILLKRNSLEKMFGVSRGLRMAKGQFKITKVVDNPNYNKNIGFKNIFKNDFSDSERDMMRMHNTTEESFKITYDLAKSFISFFAKEFDRQYPQLKNADYKNTMSIQSIEEGKKPNLGYIDKFDKNGTEIVYGFSDIKDKKKIEKYIENHICVNSFH